jgi:hypothetical protein
MATAFPNGTQLLAAEEAGRESTRIAPRMVWL